MNDLAPDLKYNQLNNLPTEIAGCLFSGRIIRKPGSIPQYNSMQQEVFHAENCYNEAYILLEVQLMEHKKRSNIAPGAMVDIVLKKDQRTGTLTRGTVKRLLTNSSTHPHGIKVELTDGQIGRVQNIIEKA